MWRSYEAKQQNPLLQFHDDQHIAQIFNETSIWWQNKVQVCKFGIFYVLWKISVLRTPPISYRRFYFLSWLWEKGIPQMKLWNEKKYEKMIHLPTVYKWIWGSFERKSAIRQNPKGPLCPTLGISWSVCIGGNFLKATFNSSTGLFADNDIARDAEFDVTDCWANRKK